MIFPQTNSKGLLTFIAVVAVAAPIMAFWRAPAVVQNETRTNGTAVAYPWAFSKGTPTARKTAVTTAEEILRKANYSSVPGDTAAEAWKSHKFATPTVGHLPSRTTLQAYGRALKVSKVMYGSVSWHTRSIWVNAGPKTISTATVTTYILDVATGRVDCKRSGTTGRSDEKSNGWKIAADVLISPLVTAVSGGPATPREQRAAQIALGKALHPWVIK